MNFDSRRLGTFRIDRLHFGVDVCSIQEVIRYQPMTAVPLAPAAVRGLINLRGQIVTAIDLRERLGLPARADDKLPMNVVLQTEGGIVSLLVDEIGDVVDALPEQFELPPPTLPSAIAALIEGAYKMPGWLLLMLNIREAVNIAHHEASLHSV